MTNTPRLILLQNFLGILEDMSKPKPILARLTEDEVLSVTSNCVVYSEPTRRIELGSRNGNLERTTSHERMQYCAVSKSLDPCRAGSGLHPMLCWFTSTLKQGVNI